MHFFGGHWFLTDQSSLDIQRERETGLRLWSLIGPRFGIMKYGWNARSLFLISISEETTKRRDWIAIGCDWLWFIMELDWRYWNLNECLILWFDFKLKNLIRPKLGVVKYYWLICMTCYFQTKHRSFWPAVLAAGLKYVTKANCCDVTSSLLWGLCKLNREIEIH